MEAYRPLSEVFAPSTRTAPVSLSVPPSPPNSEFSVERDRVVVLVSLPKAIMLQIEYKGVSEQCKQRGRRPSEAMVNAPSPKIVILNRGYGANRRQK